MASDDRPLDEVVWSSPTTVQRMGFIHTNTGRCSRPSASVNGSAPPRRLQLTSVPVQPYFAESPFFDGTSNNAVVTNQAMYNPAMFYLIQSRVAFERHLRSMAGLEFMVTHDPSDGDRVQEHSGVWVLRKQTRRKRPGQEDEITPHSSYFVVGDRIYMAPTVGGILESRVVRHPRSPCSLLLTWPTQLSTVTALTKLLATAAALPLFNPAVGHTYYSASSKAADATTAHPSREETPATAAEASQDSRQLPAPAVPRPTKSSAAHDASLLFESLRLGERFGREYMDESPLAGEPGAFVLGRAAVAGPAVPASKLASVSGSEAAGTGSITNGVNGVTGKPNQPPPLKTDLPIDDRKRGKSGGGDRSPVSASPLTPASGKKRKKSKFVGLSGGKITPT